MKNLLFTLFIATLLIFTSVSTANGTESPIDMEITGTVVLEQPTDTFRNSAIVRYLAGSEEDPILLETIWWQGEERTIVVGEERHTLKLVKVEMVDGRGTCTFEIRGRVGRPPQFQLRIKRSDRWGLEKDE